MKYKEYKQFSLAQINEEILDFWQKNQVFEQSVSQRAGKESFVFYEGPPSANGQPGIHHVMARTIKDIFCRYQTLKGKQVKRKAGWDTHGLPIELQVEKELGITKEDIGSKISVEDYNKKCRETVMKYKDAWDDMTQKIGYWVDLSAPYITFENNYIESCWALLKNLYEKDLLYKGYTIQPYSPAAGTGLSSHELNQPGCYRDVKDTSIIAQFKIKGTDHDYFLAWTTTPWTLPSNTALVVGENIDYVKIKTHNQYTNMPVNVILAKELVSKVFGGGKYVIRHEFDEAKHNTTKIPYDILEEFKGKVLEGIQYEQLLPYALPLKDADKAFRVIIGDFVTTEDGTGIVHAAPTFGADDFRVAQKNGVPPLTVLDENGVEVPLVDKKGRFVKEVTDFAGYFVKEEYYDDAQRKAADFKPTDVLIAIKLKEENKAFKVEKYEHSYPHCWRTDKPVLYYPMESWFIRTTALKDRLADLNKTINWKPESTGTGRFGNWLENLVDWNLSRSRYWGTPLPIWRTEDGKEEICIGSVEDLKNEIQKAKQAGIQTSENLDDLHRPYVDNIVLVSPSGKPMFRETDLIDVWFDSGAMPYAQWHYPFENKEIFDNAFPADFISEGVDQTRGWFFTLHAIAGLVYDSVAFKNVVSTGLVLDEKGEKMSKRKGNVINPSEMLSRFGADGVRWYMVTNAAPWENLKFSISGLDDMQRRFFGTLYNTYSFFALYANLDNFKCNHNEIVPIQDRTELDRWIISCLHSLISEVDKGYADYDVTRATRAVSYFVNELLSNWYVRLSRRRFWKGEMSQDKRAAYQTLHECLLTISQLISPVAPFAADWFYKNLTENNQNATDKISVHLTDFPVAQKNLVDEKLEERMELAQKICSLVHSLRKKNNLKVRQPLQKILIPVLQNDLKEQLEKVKDLIMAEVNVKDVLFVKDDSGVVVKKIKPNFKKLGQIYGKLMKGIGEEVAKMTQSDITILEKEGKFSIVVNAETVELTPEDVEISSSDIAGWLVAKDGKLTVALDITLTEDLKQEGIARDLVNRIQNLRKDLDFEVQDKIQIKIQKNTEIINQAIQKFGNYICEETQALSLDLVEVLENPTALEMDEFNLNVLVAKN